MAEERRDAGRFDAELAVGKVVGSTLAIAVVCALTMVLVGWMLHLLRGRTAAVDAAAPAAVALAPEPTPPPGPRLQTDPEGELTTMRREQAERLSSYGWVQQGEGTVHIPIDRAMDLLVERGLPAVGRTAAEAPR